jgi:hypothetical protein
VTEGFRWRSALGGPVPWLPLFAGVALAIAGVVAGAWLLSPTVRLGPGAGEWREVTSGIRWVPGSPTLTGQRRVLVHFHDLTTEATEVVVAVAARSPEDSLRLWFARDGEPLFSMAAPREATAITVPVPAGDRSVDVVIDAEAQDDRTRTAYRIHEILVRRKPSATRLLGAAAPVVLGCVVLLLLWRGGARWSALAWGALVTGGTLGALVVFADPVGVLRLVPATRFWLHWGGLLALWVLALARPGRLAGIAASLGTVAGLYLDTAHYGLVNEDFNFVRPWPWRDLLATLHGSWDPTGAVATYFRPVVSWSYALDFAVWGPRAEGPHLTNLLIHAALGVLAALLLERLALPPRAALAGALAWIAHPLAATAVAWTNERTDGLAVLFSLGALVVVLQTPREGTAWRGRTLVVLALAALALGSKEMAATLPVLATLCLWAARGHEGPTRERKLLAALVVLVTFYCVMWVTLFPEKVLRLQAGPRWEGLQTADGGGRWADVVAALFALVFLPVIDYERWREAAVSDLSPLYLAAGALVAPLVAALLWRAGVRHAARVATLGTVWPAITVLPLLAIVEVDVFRLGLFVCFGFAIVWGSLLVGVNERSAALAVALAVAVLAALAIPSGRSAAAWGPDGSMKAELPLWRKHEGAPWWNALTPEMQALFEDEVARLGHERRLMER